MRNLYQTTIGGGTTTPLHHFQPPIHPPSTYNTTSHQSATTAPTTVGPHVHFVDNQSTTSSNGGHINPSYHAPGLLIGPVAQLNHHFNHQQFGSSPTSRSSVKSILKLTEDGMTRANSTGQHKLSSSSSISSNSSSSSSSTYQNHHSDFYAACGSAAAHSIANHHRIQLTPSTVSSASSTSSSSSSNVSPSPLSIGLASSSSPASSPSHSPQSIMPMSKPDHLERRLQQSHEAAAAAQERQQSNERFFESNTLYKKELKQKQRDILSSSSVTPPTHQQSRLYPIVNNNSNIGQKTSSLINHLNSSVASSNNINNQQINQLQHPPPVNVLQQRAHMLQMRTKPFTSSPMELRQSELNRASEKRSTLPTHMHPTTTSTSSTTSSGSNKVLNLFTNFLSRTKSNIDDQQSTTTTNTSQPTNYLNLKNLKRASSSTHFAAAAAPTTTTTTTTTNSTTNKSKSSSSSQSSSHESSSSSSSCTSPSTSTSPTNRSLSIFNPSNLFVAKSSASNNNKRASIDTYRRSYDDVSRLNDHESVGGVGEEHDTSIINRFDENTAYSTKNNGLIFLPNNNDTNNETTLFCHENILVTSAANYENLNLGPTNPCTSPIVVESLSSKSNGAIPRTSSTFCANLHQIEEDQIQKPSDEKNAIEMKTTSTKQSPNRGKEIESDGSKKEQENGELVKQGGETSNNYNAFDNVVYSYVDNLREHSKKRLSEINLLKQSAAAAAATAAAKAVVEASSQESGSDQLISDTLNLDNTNQQSFSVKPANSNSMSSSSSSSASISPKSLCSSTDTVIINKSAPTTTTTATPSNHVLSLRDKFESQSTPTKPKTPSMTKKLLTSSAGLVVSTTSNNHNLLSSPVSVSLASSSSSSSSTSSASSSSSSSFIPPTIPSTPKTTTHINDSSSSSDSSLLIEIKNANTICNKTDLSQVSSSSSLQQTAIIKPVDFNFYNEFYKPSNESRKSAFYTSYESLLRTIKETSSSYIRSILDPIITIYPSTSSDQSNEFLFKFTVDFYQPILAAQNKYKLNGVSSSKLMDDNELSINTIDQALYIDEEAMNNETGSDTCLANIFEFLTLKDSELTTISDEFRTRANHLLNFKLNFLNSELILITNSIESNEKLGQMILSELEKKATSIELEKYKLLVNESDVITNLLIKLCNKLANTENLMSLMQMKQNQSNEEIDLLKQELNQTQRKKEEAIFLKNGIDKRANLVSKFLLNYFDSEQLENYETFMKMKLINALKMRHVKDNTDLTKLQIKLLNSF